MKIAVLFPGQGSQYVGMAQGFTETNEEYANLMKMAESACGLPLQQLCVEGSMEELTRGSNLQPAITATNLICWQAFKDKMNGDLDIHAFAGHSLGEYSALYAAGIISAEDTIKLVSKRGSLMEREGVSNPGGMRAVLGLNIEAIEEIITAYDGEGVVTAANHNTPQQIVISGSMDGLDGVSKLVEEKEGKVIPLNVSIANHSPLVADAVPDFEEYMKGIEFNTPKASVFFNVTANRETDPIKIKGIMASQIASRVRWYESITRMIEEGVDTFIEVGPKTVLKGMMRKITPKGTKVTSLQFDTPETLDKCLEKLK